jgi:hypothetical protein
MSDRHRPRLLRSISFVPLVSLSRSSYLSMVVALSAGLGLAQTVWGGPPAESPPEESTPVSADPAPSADPLAGDPLAVDPVATNTTPADLPPADEPLVDEGAASVPAASSLRAKMEDGLAQIGELAVEARNDEDLVRATCVLDKQDRANEVMDLGTSELLVIRDAGTSEQARGFALEKLDAAAARITDLVTEAKACSGQEGPEDEVDVTRRESDEPIEIPILDPSLGLGSNPVPPPLDGGWPPAASPIE